METEKIGLSKILRITCSCSPGSIAVSQQDTVFLSLALLPLYPSFQKRCYLRKPLPFNSGKLEIQTTCSRWGAGCRGLCEETVGAAWCWSQPFLGSSAMVTPQSTAEPLGLTCGASGKAYWRQNTAWQHFPHRTEEKKFEKQPCEHPGQWERRGGGAVYASEESPAAPGETVVQQVVPLQPAERPHSIRHPHCRLAHLKTAQGQHQSVPLDNFNGIMNSKVFPVFYGVTKSADCLTS